jgi:hypothetical protein
MKHLRLAALYVLVLSLITLFSCNDPTVIGSDLLAGDQLDIEFTDTLTIRAWTVQQDSVKTYDKSPLSSEYSFFPCGDLRDPVFGKSIARINTQLSLNTSSPDFDEAVIDSVILLLPYQKDKLYGKLDEIFDLEVWELDETLYDSLNYYSNHEAKLKPAMIGFAQFRPKTDSITVIVPAKDTLITEKLPPHLRIRMEDAFVQAFLYSDSANFTSNKLFRAFFKGLQVRPPANGSGNQGMLNFNFRHSLAGLQVYYHEDTKFSQYKFPVFSSSLITAEFVHEYEGAFVKDYLGENGSRNDSLLFLQGMSGLNFDLEIPYADKLEKLIINRAEVLLPVVDLAGDNPDFDPVEQIVVSEIVNDTTFRTIDDLTFSINRAGDNFPQLFGGKILSNHTYRVNISAHFQDMIRGQASKKMRFAVYLKPENASRVVIGGPTHATLPAKLRLSFTRF